MNDSHAPEPASTASPSSLGLETLLRRRAALVTAVDALLDGDAAQRAAAHDDEGGDPGFYYRNQLPANEAAISRAEEELAVFDAAHPEALEALRAEKVAARQRFWDVD